MARFFARFDHDDDPTLESETGNNFFDRRVIGSATSSNAVLVEKRRNLSEAMTAQLNAGSRDPDVGPIIPQSNTAGDQQNITRTGGDLSWNKVYRTTTIPGVVPPADYRTRPTSSIYTDDGNLTEITPSDPGTISDTLYTDATDALANVLASIKKIEGAPPHTTDGSPYTRLGINPGRTLHSIWHDKDLNYFAWDDFTPGQVQAFTAAPRANGVGVFTLDFNDFSVTDGLIVESGDSVFIRLNWTNEYRADLAGDSVINATATPAGSTARTLSSFNPGQGVLQYDWDIGSSLDVSNNVAPGRELTLNSADVRFKDAVIPAHTGIEATISSGVVATVLRVQQKSIKFIAQTGGITANYFCTNNVAAVTYYSNFISNTGTPCTPSTPGDQCETTLGVGAYRVFTSKTSGASLGAGYYIAGGIPNSPSNYTWWSSEGGDIDDTGTVTC